MPWGNSSLLQFQHARALPSKSGNENAEMNRGRRTRLELVSLVVLSTGPSAREVCQIDQALAHPTRHNLISHLSRGQRRRLPWPIVRGCDLDNVRADHVQPLQTAKDADELATRPSSGFWGACPRTLAVSARTIDKAHVRMVI